MIDSDLIHDYERPPFMVTGERFVSVGFVAEEDDEPMEIGGMDIGKCFRIKLGFMRAVELKLGDETEPSTRVDLAFRAEPDEVHIQSDVMSPVLAGIRAYSYFRDTLESLG